MKQHPALQFTDSERPVHTNGKGALDTWRFSATGAVREALKKSGITLDPWPDELHQLVELLTLHLAIQDAPSLASLLTASRAVAFSEAHDRLAEIGAGKWQPETAAESSAAAIRSSEQFSTAGGQLVAAAAAFSGEQHPKKYT